MGEIGQQIFRSLNFEKFQELVIHVVMLILNKGKYLGQDDRTIIDNSFSLWISVIVFNPELFTQLDKSLVTQEEDLEKNLS